MGLQVPWPMLLLAFVLGHDYDLPGQLAIAVFALGTAWITWRTGGLEAAIALHVVNNLAASLVGFGGIGDLAATEVGWPVALADAAAVAAFVLWVEHRIVRARPVSPASRAGSLDSPGRPGGR
ncbi:hypothetical protein GCM10027060_22680 [Nesterenkonia halophila]|uniref:CPBP family intramembrane glutamic endopeptidase n=1 Tax=Nesterenkonia halophila TaxID=302044 RepID=UPI0012915365|nr:CPBP family intramembrane glutamic endopeptidase [Nesterenkonia halophila]